MAFEGLSERLQEFTRKLRGKARITEQDLNDMLREVKLALLEADVNYKVVKEFIGNIHDKALGQDVLKSLTPGQQVIKIVKDELVDLLGGNDSKINFNPNQNEPTIIMMVGLQGSGKTTTCGKIANLLRKQGKKPLMVACDVYRPAAIKQLQVIGSELNIPVYANENEKNVVKIAKQAKEVAISKLCDVILVDTAGRLQIDETLMNELKELKNNIHPDEILLVVDSMIGQEAVNVAQKFNDELSIDGMVLTKLDGDTRGGAALTIRHVVTKPIKFISIGEKLDALDVFHPDRMANRILGMGDIVSLVEKAQEQYDEQEARKLSKKIHSNTFDFNDFLSQIQQIKKMGNLKDIMGMIPGVGKMMKDVDIKEDAFKNIEAIIGSMTPQEREHPNIIDVSRKQRIAKGSGTKIEDVNRLLKQFDQTRKMMQSVSSGKMNKMAAMRNLRKRR